MEARLWAKMENRISSEVEARMAAGVRAELKAIERRLEAISKPFANNRIPSCATKSAYPPRPNHSNRANSALCAVGAPLSTSTVSWVCSLTTDAASKSRPTSKAPLWSSAATSGYSR